MLYIRKFYVVQKIYIFISISIHRWDTGTQLQWQVTNMACNDLRARGAWGRDAPPSQRELKRESTDWDTGTQMTTGILGI